MVEAARVEAVEEAAALCINYSTSISVLQDVSGKNFEVHSLSCSSGVKTSAWKAAASQQGYSRPPSCTYVSAGPVVNLLQDSNLLAVSTPNKQSSPSQKERAVQSDKHQSDLSRISRRSAIEADKYWIELDLT